MKTLQELMQTLPQVGEVTWIGVRPATRQPMIEADRVEAVMGHGLTGDRFKARRADREVTLIQAEHIDAVASIMGKPVLPALLRRNIVVSGINLIALKGKTFQIGSAQFEMTGPAEPCSRMEEALGPGGYNAMRGHGGITARIMKSGVVAVGDKLTIVPPQKNQP